MKPTSDSNIFSIQSEAFANIFYTGIFNIFENTYSCRV